MRRYLLLQVFLATFSLASAQNSFEQEASKIVKYIARNMKASDIKTTGTPVEFSVYDFTLDTSGNITTDRILLLDSLTGLKQARILGAAIKRNTRFPKSKYSKLLVPVMIVHSGNYEDPSLKDLALLETVRFFEILSKRDIGDVFVTKYVGVIQFE